MEIGLSFKDFVQRENFPDFLWKYRMNCNLEHRMLYVTLMIYLFIYFKLKASCKFQSKFFFKSISPLGF